MYTSRKPDFGREQYRLFGDCAARKTSDPIKKKRSPRWHCPDRAVMYCDGASSGNPGNAGIGVIIYPSGEEGIEGEGNKNKITLSGYIGITTNNVAEYAALIAGLEKAVSLGIKKLAVFLDSELIVRQINGIYKVKNKNLIPLWTKAVNILQEFDVYTVRHVRRELNKEADALARAGIKKRNK